MITRLAVVMKNETTKADNKFSALRFVEKHARFCMFHYVLYFICIKESMRQI